MMKNNLISTFAIVVWQRSVLIALLTLASCPMVANAQLSSQPLRKPLQINNIKIKQLAPVWTMTTGNNPLLQRDAKLLPAEQNLALILQPLLNKKDYTGALRAIKQSTQPDYSGLYTLRFYERVYEPLRLNVHGAIRPN